MEITILNSYTGQHVATARTAEELKQYIESQDVAYAKAHGKPCAWFLTLQTEYLFASFDVYGDTLREHTECADVHINDLWDYMSYNPNN